MNGIVLGGTASGVGKTVTTLAVLRALEAAGRSVQPAKAGPDFIDPSHHAAVVGTDQPARTLDPWLEGESGLRRNYHRGTGDICVVEGMMGLYDGDQTSTAQIAELLGLPVVLVVDGSASAASVAATAHGFDRYADRAGRAINVAGVIAARTHGGAHERAIREALPAELSYCGRVPPLDGLTVPERHLGLHGGSEAPVDETALETAAAAIRTDRLIGLAAAPPAPPADRSAPETAATVAVAHDDAFRFVYPAVRERLTQRATVHAFAPAAGDDLPARDLDLVYLPGGYPERHAAALAASPGLATLAARASDGLPVLAECGGLMTLAETLTVTDSHEMAGVLPCTVTLRDRCQAVDHVALRGQRASLIAAPGDRLRGHEFHYSAATVGRDARFAFAVERGQGIDGDHDGMTEYKTLGTYSHFHAESGAFDAALETITDD